MANTCIPGDVTELRVSVNGAQKGILDASPGASGTFAGTSGNSHLAHSNPQETRPDEILTGI
jgi:hypothetical protein